MNKTFPRILLVLLLALVPVISSPNVVKAAPSEQVFTVTLGTQYQVLSGLQDYSVHWENIRAWGYTWTITRGTELIRYGTVLLGGVTENYDSGTIGA